LIAILKQCMAMFAVLNDIEPESRFIAEGSSVGIEWKRNRLNLDDERS
jgi:hypothetical protein